MSVRESAQPVGAPAPFRLYNTLSRTVEPFVPLKAGHVGLYVCGMTVYDEAHLGHARAMVVFDTFVRYLRHRGWNTTFVRNFTDVDDKIIDRARERGEDPLALAQAYVDAFRRDAAGLELIAPDAEPRVTTSMDDIRAMIADLIAKGHAYVADGSVWFSVSTSPNYGELSGQDPDQLRNSDVGSKRDGRDFAVWKGAKSGEPAWPSPWGPGRPGWHIECSAMIQANLGPAIDIHGGGLDLVFPHHENEIVQSECASGHRPFVRYWMHNGLLTLADGRKMGKSLGNAVNIRHLLTEFPAESLRLYYLQTHYRSPLPWTDGAQVESLGMLARLYDAREAAEAMGGTGRADDVARDLGPEAVDALALARGFTTKFFAALDEDFNTAQALGHAFELARATNRLANHKSAKKRGGPIAAEILTAFALLASLGLLTHNTAEFQAEVKQKRLSAMGLATTDVERLLDARQAARAAKDWAQADTLRGELERYGIVVMDRPEGVEWRVRLADAG
jgi:cysteinyl-tRNA synthetase